MGNGGDWELRPDDHRYRYSWTVITRPTIRSTWRSTRACGGTVGTCDRWASATTTGRMSSPGSRTLGGRRQGSEESGREGQAEAGRHPPPAAGHARRRSRGECAAEGQEVLVPDDGVKERDGGGGGWRGRKTTQESAPASSRPTFIICHFVSAPRRRPTMSDGASRFLTAKDSHQSKNE